MQVGTVDLDHRLPHVVTMRVSNPDGLSAAYADVDKIAFVAHDLTADKESSVRFSSGPPAIAEGTVKVSRDRPAYVVVPASTIDRTFGQLDVFVVDSATRHEHRLFFRYDK